MKKTAIVVLLVLALSFVFTACANYDFAEEGNYIVSPKDAVDMIGGGAILVDAQSAEDYAVSHIEGAVNIPMGALTVSEPYPNMIADKKQVKQVMGDAGVSENDMIIVYDNASNMQAARIQWTLNYYGNFNVKVISGGLNALKEQGLAVSTTETVLEAKEYNTGDKQRKLNVKISAINDLIDTPEENTYIIDTRSLEEHMAGTIPGSVHIEYVWNNYANGEYKSPRDIRLTYLSKDIMPDDKLILYCKTSVRAAQTYTALKDAGYKDVRVYDGAWLEFEAENGPQAPAPEEVTPTQTNAS